MFTVTAQVVHREGYTYTKHSGVAGYKLGFFYYRRQLQQSGVGVLAGELHYKTISSNVLPSASSWEDLEPGTSLKLIQSEQA